VAHFRCGKGDAWARPCCVLRSGISALSLAHPHQIDIDVRCSWRLRAARSGWRALTMAGG